MKPNRYTCAGHLSVESGQKKQSLCLAQNATMEVCLVSGAPSEGAPGLGWGGVAPRTAAWAANLPSQQACDLPA